MNFIDSFLNKITMYKLVFYGLIMLSSYALAASLLGFASLSFSGLAISLSILLLISYGTNKLLSHLFDAPANVESVWITSLILFLTLAPPVSITEAFMIALAAFLAMVSKYVLAFDRKHIFNPAAVSLFILNVIGTGMASWWIGAPLFLPVVLVLGLMIVRKIRRFDLFFSFIVTSVAMIAISSFTLGLPIAETLASSFLSGPMIFFATVMLTEPITMPSSKNFRVVFGVLIGIIFGTPMHFVGIFSTPQVALLIGNLYAYVVSSRQKLFLTLKGVDRLSSNIYEFIFNTHERLDFQPGQYLEWTLPHTHSDSRGVRRYFTISSSPEDEDIRFAVRMSKDGSTFKKALTTLKDEAIVVGSSLSGDFTLPQDKKQKLVFIAGGVGITPFISMLRHILVTGETRDIDMFYLAAEVEDLAYKDIIEESAKRLGLRISYLTGNEKLTEERIRTFVQDSDERLFYLSGPQGMVSAYKKLLLDIGIRRRSIVTDYFPGF